MKKILINIVTKQKINCHKSTMEFHKEETVCESLLRKKYITEFIFYKRDCCKVSHLLLKCLKFLGSLTETTQFLGKIFLNEWLENYRRRTYLTLAV